MGVWEYGSMGGWEWGALINKKEIANVSGF
jgi:hypothetical protein